MGTKRGARRVPQVNLQLQPLRTARGTCQEPGPAMGLKQPGVSDTTAPQPIVPHQLQYMSSNVFSLEWKFKSQWTKTVIQTSAIKHEDTSVFHTDTLVFSSFLIPSDIELLHLRGHGCTFGNAARHEERAVKRPCVIPLLFCESSLVVCFSCGFQEPKPSNAGKQGIGIQTAVAHQLCPHEDEGTRCFWELDLYHCRICSETQGNCWCVCLPVKTIVIQKKLNAERKQLVLVG
ncbi:uncharacterized protein LOC130248805 [Oenanthe melanoleuca]|uniref:uncharacterized protein LOC130248805 n=1 Tax=Oenanthe melanoleuca TaxID=2939378 RepID=UPI0024C1A1A5|nr:uncharacterized protein LOC130248805 [Oenanthe melanoleuca]